MWIFFIATTHVMIAWTKEYMGYVKKYLAIGLTNTNQQVLYSMQCDNQNPHTEGVAYQNTNHYVPWFYLGLMCTDAGKNQLGNVTQQ